MREGLMDEGVAGPALCFRLSQDESEEQAYH